MDLSAVTDDELGSCASEGTTYYVRYGRERREGRTRRRGKAERGSVTIVNRSSDSIAEYRRQQATSASPRPCTLKRGSTMFVRRQNKATSQTTVLNTLPFAYDETPSTSKQDAEISPAISNQCFNFGLAF